MRTAKATFFCVSAFLAIALAPPASAITVDGTAEATYGPAISTQTTQTQFGDNGDPAVDFASGSELDEVYGVISGGSLFLVLGGNVESNFNKMEIFIDSQGGGQNKLQGNNPDVDFNGLNRMGDDGSGNGLTFDTGFESDYYMMVTGGNNPYELFANFAPTDGSGGFGTFVGGGPGTIHLGGALGISFAMNNSNTAGVSGGCDASSGAGVATGVEVEIPLSVIGSPTGCITVSAFINAGSHDFLANQVLGPLPVGTCNLGEPRLVDFNQHAGLQHFTVCGMVSVEQQPWSNVKTLYR